ncbi:putative disease resistance protein At1g50180 [Herrania umbratica]|uniref:Disease resistance protein At1g50180 n=1 Tax=Herrania umbratica TaxID=108875 RepID=A0A6J0ZJS8_9ROSI|nr:putative disease resistance protein At1g50180 [Herrania umbratica]
MAEFAVSLVVEKLTNLLAMQAAYLDGVSQKIVQLRNELRWMQSFLKDADMKQEEDELMQQWVSDVRDVAYDTEEVIETYVSRAASQKPFDLVTKPFYHYKVGRKIESIRSRIREITGRRETYGGLGNGRSGGEGAAANDRLRWWRQPSPHVEEDDIIELVEDTKALLTQLTSMESRRRVVSIVGMGGLGKTTLAKRLYNHNDVKNHFDCRAWIYVSKEYRRKEILQGIITDVNAVNRDEMEVLEKLKEEVLLKKLHEFLEERRYLVVLDDVWSMEVWDCLENAFPSGKTGSKVMVTTRNKEVALHADGGGIPHEPRILTEDESLKLFCKKAFHGMKSLPPELKKLGRDMIVRCGGLPLAVVVLGGLLSRKIKSTEEWHRVLRNITWHLTKGQDRIAAILALSYNDLPSHLKSCFLYLGLFPEDVSVQTRKLIHLWVAEGFLPQEGEETAEGVAEKCLTELIDRCMIQVGRLSSLGRVKTVRIHDLLRDLAISQGRKQIFLEIHHRNKAESTECISIKSRRHAIHSRHDQYTFLKHFAPHLRSLLFFNREYNVDVARKIMKVCFRFEKKLNVIYKNFKLLRVLDLEGVRVVSLPDTIGSLIQLRYLGLRKTNLEEELPLSIGNLQNLQTLDLRYSCFLKRIPNVIWKLVHLRHLLLYTPFDSPDSWHLKMDTLCNLQSLPYIEAGSWIDDGGLANMTNLRQLGIDGLSREQVTSVISTMEKLQDLQSLSLLLVSALEMFPTLTGLSHCEHLQKLCFYGKMEKLPDPQEFPPSLIKLTLYNSQLQRDSITKLERLPNLEMLVLGEGSYNLRDMTFSSESFPKLEILRLHLLKELEEWTVEERAMPKLKHLVINRCEKLKRIPDGLKLATSLKELEIVGMPVEFEYRLRTKDFMEFKHTPSIKSTTDMLAIGLGSHQNVGWPEAQFS